MSSVDERIVQMRFDNGQFESGIRTSIKSLDDLKQGLKLDAASASLSNLEKAGRNFSLAGMASSVDTIASKFTTLGIIGVTTLQNLTNTALNTGKNMIKALTIDPVKMGFDEYETKMNAIQTILTNTASKGTKMSDVTKALDELNKYADLTIYDFAEMTRNIGTFTAAGVDLKTSVTSIKGIANLAAGSGSTALQASTAMYQLSQAIAAGSVKLQDWNSVVNAGMGGELFQKGLEKTAKELGHGRDMSKSFRESLQDGWITTEVLTKTLQKFANDKSLLEAATQVKTFTQLFDTMKESVQSGWAQSWEAIIGNKDEAAKLFTSINDTFSSIAGKSADARNAILEFWKANGGRDALIQALANVFKNLGTVLSTIGQSFSEIFPPITGQRLVEMTKNFRDLTASFKIGDATLANIKSTFKGLFAVLDIGVQAFYAVAGGIVSLIKYLAPAGSGFLSFTGTIGDFLVALDSAIKKSNAFNVAIAAVGNVMKPIIDGIKVALSGLVDAVKSLGVSDMSGMTKFTEQAKKMGDAVAPVTRVGDILKNVFSKVTEVMHGFYTLAGKIGDLFGKLRDKITEAFSNTDMDSMLKTLNGGLFAGILLGLNKFINSLTKITDSAGGFVKGITGILDGVKGSLAAYQSQLKAGTLLKIAFAIGILAVSLTLLATINPERLTTALAAMTGAFAELFGSMSIFEKIIGSAGFVAMTKITTTMIGLSIAVLLLSVAMAKLAALNPEEIGRGLFGIATMSIILVKAAKALSDGTKGLVRASTGLILFALAINILAIAVSRLGKLDPVVLAKGLISVGVLVSELALFMRATDLSGMGIKSAIGILILAVALGTLASAVKTLGEIDDKSLVKGLGSIAIVLAEIGTFIALTGGDKRLISTAIGINFLGTAMLILASAVAKMGGMSLEQMGKGLIGLAGSLGIMVLALRMMPKSALLNSFAILDVATAMVGISKALSTMGKMSWDEVARSLTLMGASLLMIGTMFVIMKQNLADAGALLIVVGAIFILAQALNALGKMSLAEVGVALLAIAGAFTIIGLAGLILGPLTPVILALAGAIALLGLGCLAVGAGMLAFSAGLAALAVSGTAGAAALVAIIMSIVGLIPAIFKTLAQGIVDFAVVIGNGAPVIATAVMQVLLGIIDTITTVTPQIINCIVTLLTTMLTAMATAVPQMVVSGMQLVLGILNGIAANIASVVAAGINVILQFIMGVASELPAIIDTAFKVVISFINGLADAIRNNHAAIYNAVANLIGAIIQAVFGLIPAVVDVGANIIKGFMRGFASMGSALVNAAKGVVGDAVEGVKKFLGIHSPSRVFAEIGKFSALGFAGGLSDFAGAVASQAKDVGATAMDSLKGAVSGISDVVNGNVDVNPTIRPVLDLGGVTSGMGAIDSMLNRNQNISVGATTTGLVSSIGTGVDSNLQNGSTLSTMVDSVKAAVQSGMSNASVDLSGTLQVQVVNDKGDIIGIAQTAVRDLLRRESR